MEVVRLINSRHPHVAMLALHVSEARRWARLRLRAELRLEAIMASKASQQSDAFSSRRGGSSSAEPAFSS